MIAVNRGFKVTVIGHGQGVILTLPCRVFVSTLTAVGRSQLLARWPGTHSRILSAIQRAVQTVLGVYLKRTCSRVTGASSALGVLNELCAIHIHALTHSLTHSNVLFTNLLTYLFIRTAC